MATSRARVFYWLMLVLLSAFSGRALAADDLATKIEAVIACPEYREAAWGILVVDSRTGKPLYEHNGDKLFAPASTTKLYSCAAALGILGPDFRFDTPVYQRGQLKDGRLVGDLILVALGDLTFGGRTDASGHIAFKDDDHIYANGNSDAALTETDPLGGLRALARKVAMAGIREVRGEVLVDDRLFTKSRGSGSGPDLLTPILVNDNVVDILVTPAEQPGRPARVRMRPETSYVHMDAQVTTVAEGRRVSVAVQSVGPRAFTVRGEIPLRPTPLVRIYPVEDPTAFARALFIEVLRKEGVQVNASPLQAPRVDLPPQDGYASLTRIASYQSPPLSEAIKVTLKVSHNLYASTLPLLLAVKEGKRTLAEGMRIQGRFLADLGVDVKTISFAGGAGGANADAVTPRATVQLLRALAKRPEYKAFYDGLPVLGVDGTLARVVPKSSPARGKVHAKTGTLSWADLLNDRTLLTSKALAGTMTTATNRSLTFALFVNRVPLTKDVTSRREGAVLGHLCEIIYEHAR